MSKVLKLLSVLIILGLFSSTFVFAETESETTYDEYASELKTIGVFQGTNNGFELDRPPTRLEGLIMLIRLLGKEDEAMATDVSFSYFSDVPDWGRYYTNYAYEKGLTEGIGNGKFGTDDDILAKSFHTFILRALGYKDSQGDFQWDTATEFIYNLGIIESDYYVDVMNHVFLRDHVAKSAYDALFANLKGSETILIDYLIATGDIDQEAANGLSLRPIKIDDSNKPDSIDPEPVDSIPDETDSDVPPEEETSTEEETTPEEETAEVPEEEATNPTGDETAEAPQEEPIGTPVDESFVSPDSISVGGIEIGMTLDNLLSIKGNPSDILANQYSSQWYVYAADYSQFMVVEVKDNQVVGLYSNRLMTTDSGITIGSSGTQATNQFSLQDGYGYRWVVQNGYRLHFFVNETGANEIEAIYIYDDANNWSSTYTETTIRSYEKMVFYLVNATRNEVGQGALEWLELARESSVLHSEDMATNDYFAHEGLNGSDHMSRMIAVGIQGSSYGENLAAGFEDPFKCHFGLVHSPGHYANMISNYYSHVGIGLYVNQSSTYNYYVTENFVGY